MLYQWFIRPFLYLLKPEAAHGLIIFMLRTAQVIPGMQALLSVVFRTPKGIGVDALGMHFPSPIGLAAGFDKDAEVYPALGAIGFGFIEVGTITGEGQPGNPQPRLFRLVEDRALLNRMGFNNHGAEHAARQLAKRGKGRAILGINIGKTKLVAAEDAPADYEKSARLLGPFADYMVVNVSSPNTPGLRDLQAVESLRPILEVTRRALDEAVRGRRVPLLVKIAPDLSDEDVLAVGDLALELGLDGIIATNTTISRKGLTLPESEIEALGAGGVSGAPLKRRALDVLRLLRQRTDGKLVLIAAGGIETAADAWDRLRAGADLVQIYSAMIYEGAALPSKMARGLGARMNKEGVHSLRDVIGADV